MIVLRLDRNALTQLIESQPEEFKLELSKAVLAEATKTVVRGIISEETKAIIAEATKEAIREQIGEVKGAYPNRRVAVSNDVSNHIDTLVRNKAREMVQGAYKDFLETMNKEIEGYKKVVSEVVKREVEKGTQEAIENELRAKFDDMLRKMAS